MIPKKTSSIIWKKKSKAINKHYLKKTSQNHNKNNTMKSKYQKWEQKCKRWLLKVPQILKNSYIQDNNTSKLKNNSYNINGRCNSREGWNFMKPLKYKKNKLKRNCLPWKIHWLKRKKQAQDYKLNFKNLKPQYRK